MSKRSDLPLAQPHNRDQKRLLAEALADHDNTKGAASVLLTYCIPLFHLSQHRATITHVEECERSFCLSVKCPIYASCAVPRQSGDKRIGGAFCVKGLHTMTVEKPPHQATVDHWIGRRFGRLTVKAFHSRKNKSNIWECLCDCGEIRLVRAQNLLRGATTSCGCYLRDVQSERHTTHGMTGTPAYRAWRSMLRRCYSPSSAHYDKYGGRGIRVCNRWRDFINFYQDMGEPPGGTTIDRIDNDGDYEPSNCRWANQHQQSRNRSDNVWLTHNGRTMVVADWAREVGLSPSTIRGRLLRGWEIERSLFTPPMSKGVQS